MRQAVKEFAEIVAATLPVQGPVYEFGALLVPGQFGFGDLRPLFTGVEFVGADMREGPGVDRILNLHDIDVPDGEVGTVLCLDTLEHVEYPRRAMEEIHRILKPDGMAVITSVMKFPIHDYPHDYWRFTPEAFRSILKPFADVFVGSAGQPDFPSTVVGIGFKGRRPDMSAFESRIRDWPRAGKAPFRQKVKQWIPPALAPVAARCYKAIDRRGR